MGETNKGEKRTVEVEVKRAARSVIEKIVHLRDSL
jgi:hypothetical protein